LIRQVTMAARVFFSSEMLTKLIQKALYDKNSEVVIVDSESRFLALTKETIDKTWETKVVPIKDLEELKLLNNEVFGKISSEVKEKKENNIEKAIDILHKEKYTIIR